MSRRIPIQRRLRWMMITISMLPLFLLLIVWSAIQINSISNTENERSSKQISSLQDNLDDLMKEAYQIGKTVSGDEDIISTLMQDLSDETQRHAVELNIDRVLSYISQFSDPRVKVYIIAENQALLKNNASSFIDTDFRETTWYTDILFSNGEKWFPISGNSKVVKTVSKTYVSLGFPIRTPNQKESLGVVLVETEIQELLPELHNNEGSFYVIYPDYEMQITDGRVEMFEDTFITAFQNGEIVSGYDSTVLPHYVDATIRSMPYWRSDFLATGLHNTNGYIVCYATMQTNRWILVKCIPIAEQYYPVIRFILVVFCLMVGLTFALLLLVNRLSKSFTVPILSLSQSARAVGHGNLDVKISKVRDDEIGDLTDQFNWMVSHIKSLLERIIEEKNVQRRYEFLLLQAQINPHFLYNTLDSIVWLVRMKKNENAETMLESLITFFKTGLNKGNDTLSLSKEIENVESYIRIQSFRYKSKLSYSLHVDETVSDFVVPKLILQPLVENAIYHGIKEKDGPGHICIECGRTGRTIQLIVSDDGIGMDPDTLNRLLTQQDTTRDSYGVSNVVERLKMYFNDRAHVSIESRLNCGTTVSIFIETEEDSNV